MMRRLVHGGAVVLMMAVAGCASDSRDGLIRSTSNQLAEATNSVEAITAKLKEYEKSKENRNEEAAKKELDDAIAAAKKLKDSAKQLQELYRKADAVAPPTAEGKKELREEYAASVKNFTREVVSASEKHREMKTALAEVTKKYGEEPLRPLLQEIQETDTEFAAITRKR